MFILGEAVDFREPPDSTHWPPQEPELVANVGSLTLIDPVINISETDEDPGIKVTAS